METRTIEILLHNKEKMILIYIPVGATNLDLSVMGIHYKYLDEDCRIDLDNADVMFEILGEYNPITGTINFEVKEEWVEKLSVSGFGEGFKDYKHENDIGKENFKTDFLLHGSAAQSFLSLLKSETEKMWPLKENTAKEPTIKGSVDTAPHYASMVRHDRWQESEAKVLPKRFICLLVKQQPKIDFTIPTMPEEDHSEEVPRTDDREIIEQPED